jgi:hypothetical protein
VFAVCPSVDELGHTFGLPSERPRAALEEIDRQLVRGIIEACEGTTVAYREAASESRRLRVRELSG